VKDGVDHDALDLDDLADVVGALTLGHGAPERLGTGRMPV
jgi:hypothetical protein